MNGKLFFGGVFVGMTVAFSLLHPMIPEPIFGSSWGPFIAVLLFVVGIPVLVAGTVDYIKSSFH